VRSPKITTHLPRNLQFPLNQDILKGQPFHRTSSGHGRAAPMMPIPTRDSEVGFHVAERTSG
jgi:hypothetical protein